VAQQQQVASLYGRISVQLRDALAGLRDFRSRLGQATNNLKTMRDQSKITGAAVNAALTVPLDLLGKTAVGMAADYEKSMSVFQLVTKASSEQMAISTAAVEALSHDLELPQFTKPQVAEALTELAKAGLGASDAVSALRPSLLLAAAGEADAVQGAALLGAALKEWQLPASDAGKVADMLAATMKFSGVSFTDLVNTVQNAGPAFSAAQVPMADFLTAVGVLAQNGIKGAEAGTALQNMLQSLLAPTDQARALMAGLGVHVYDAQNRIRPFRDIIGDLHDAFARLNPAQQEAYAQTIFGSSAFGEALILIKGGLPAYDAMHEKITQVGIAEELAKAKTEGLAGGIADAKREMQNAAQSAIDPMAADLTYLAHTLADAFRWFQALPAPVREGVGVIAALLALLGPLGLLFAGVSAAISGVTAAAGVVAGVLGAVAEVLAVVGVTVAGPILLLGVLAAALVIAYQHSEAFRDVVDAAFAAVAGAVRDAVAAVVSVLAGFGGALGAAASSAAGFGAAVAAAFGAALQVVAGWWNGVSGLLNGFLGLVQRVVDAVASLADLRVTLPAIPNPVAAIGGLFGGGGSSSASPPAGFSFYNTRGQYIDDVIGPGAHETEAFRAGTDVVARYRAAGGPVQRGEAYVVGEAGPELFVPAANGLIVPNGGLAAVGGGGGGDVNVNFYGPVFGYQDFEDQVVLAVKRANQAGRRVSLAGTV
jgi:TP901 family phage tail tape measure protein